MPPKKSKLESQLSILSNKELRALYSQPNLFLADYQIPPATAWRYFLFSGGRGSGKSFAGLYWLYGKILNGAKALAIVGPDFGTVENNLVPMFMNCFPPDQKPEWNAQRKVIKCPNGAVVYVYTAMQEIRGPNIEYAFCDEICKWCQSIPEQIQEAFDTFEMTLRLGDNPQIFIASTPKPMMWFKKFYDEVKAGNPLYALRGASMEDNAHLSDNAKTALRNKFGTSRFGAQELDGIINFDVQGALWTPKLLDETRVGRIPVPSDIPVEVEYNPLDVFWRIVIGADPSAKNDEDGDEFGVSVVGMTSDLHCYLLEDASGQFKVKDGIDLLHSLYHHYGADCIVVENNNGGDYIIDMMKSTFKPSECPNIKPIFAKHNKVARAEPVANLHQNGQIHFVGYFSKLEEQLCSFTGDPRQASPDRLDAFVYAVRELRIEVGFVPRDIDDLPDLQ